jgi:hypothetical protein
MNPQHLPGPKRFVVEIVPTADGRVVGTVHDGGGPVAFSGWLDLLRLLEPPGPPPEVEPWAR